MNCIFYTSYTNDLTVNGCGFIGTGDGSTVASGGPLIKYNVFSGLYDCTNGTLSARAIESGLSVFGYSMDPNNYDYESQIL